jgi:hypothetical protein
MDNKTVIGIVGENDSAVDVRKLEFPKYEELKEVDYFKTKHFLININGITLRVRCSCSGYIHASVHMFDNRMHYSIKLENNEANYKKVCRLLRRHYNILKCYAPKYIK